MERIDEISQDQDCLEVEESSEESEVVSEADTDDAPVKGEDIYVENDIGDLDRMLGIAPNESVIDVDTEDETSDLGVTTDLFHEPEQQDVPINDVSGQTDDESGVSIDINVPSKEDVVEAKFMSFVPLTSFMVEDKSNFNYLEKVGICYTVSSIPIAKKEAIKRAVSGKSYLFRYPKYVLKDMVLGYKELWDNDKQCAYKFYFPEYSVTFTIPHGYKKPFLDFNKSLSSDLKDYLEDLVIRTHLYDLTVTPYKHTIPITSLKVLETGLIEVATKDGYKKLFLNNSDIDFYTILDYIRQLSDSGLEELELKILPEFFVDVTI